jgi:hypothetical protein
LLEYPNGIEFSQAGKFYRNNGNNINTQPTLGNLSTYKENNTTFIKTTHRSHYQHQQNSAQVNENSVKQIQLPFIFSSSPPLSTSTSSSSASSLASSITSLPFHFSLFR